MQEVTAVPQKLITWFKIHCIADVIFALPLFIIPCGFLAFFQLPFCDPFTARITAAALFGIGITSWFVTDASLQVFKKMLLLKIIWSFFATSGIIITIIQYQMHILSAYVVFFIFFAFHLLWLYWLFRIRKL